MKNLFTLFITVWSILGHLNAQPDLKVRLDNDDLYTKEVGEIYHSQSFVQNIGNVTANSSYMKYYLSVDTSLDAADIYLGQDYVKQLTINNESEEGAYLTVPQVPSGFYYVLHVADANSQVIESNENNNVKAGPLLIQGADLEAISVSYTSSTIDAGQSKNVNYQIKNTGNLTLNSGSARFYLSTNTTYSSSDTFLGSVDINNLFPNTTITNTTSLTIPDNTIEDSYYIILRTTSNQDYNNDNDIVTSNTHFFVEAEDLPTNLAFDKLVVKKNGSEVIFDSESMTNTPTLSSTNSYTIEFTIVNNGNGIADPVSFATFFSYNNTLNIYNDVFLFEDESNTPLQPNQTLTLTGTFNVGSGIGTAFPLSNGSVYNLIFFIDHDNQVDETDESAYDNEPALGFYFSTNYLDRSKKNGTYNQKNAYTSAINAEIYNFSGEKIIASKDFQSEVQIKEYVQTLKKGLYIVKYSDGTTFKIAN